MQSCSVVSSWCMHPIILLSKSLLMFNTTVGCFMPSCTSDTRKKKTQTTGFFPLSYWWYNQLSALVFPGFYHQFLAIGSAFGEISPHFMPFPLSQGRVTSSEVTCCSQGCFPLLPFKCFSVLTVSQVEHRMFVALVRG